MTSESPAAPDVTVSIVNHRRREALLRLLASLEPEVEGPLALEVVVLDNASDDGSVEAVGERFPWARVLAERRRRGFGANQNRVLAETGGRHVLVLSHDAEVERGSVAALAAYLDAHPRVGAVAPRLRYPDGRAQDSAWRFPTPAASALALLSLGRIGIVQSRGERPRRVDWAMGAALALRRRALEDVGGFDEGFFMYSEETDLSLRLAHAGWETHFLPGAVVVHADSDLRRELPVERICEEWRSRHRYWRKHHSPAGARAAALLGAGAYAARGAVAALAERVRPGTYPPGFPARMRLHAAAARRPPIGPGLREAAEEWNRAHGAAPPSPVEAAGRSGSAS